MRTRWGIVGTGRSAADFATTLKTLKEEHLLVAVCGDTLSKAEAFADKHEVPTAYGSCDDIAADPQVEVVYIAAKTQYRKETAKIMLEAGKHVLCEMPMAVKLKETKKLIDLARKKEVFLMEAIWSRFFPIYKMMKKAIDNGAIGKVQQVMCSLGKYGRRGVYPLRKVNGSSCILDYGIFCVQFVSLIMGGERPKQVAAAGHLDKFGGAATANCSIVYSGGRLATISSSSESNLPCEGFVIGTKGTIKIPFPLWCPVSMEMPNGMAEVPLPYCGEDFYYMIGPGMVFAATEVRECLKKGLLESPTITLDESLTIAEIAESMKNQVEVDCK